MSVPGHNPNKKYEFGVLVHFAYKIEGKGNHFYLFFFLFLLIGNEIYFYFFLKKMMRLLLQRLVLRQC